MKQHTAMTIRNIKDVNLIIFKSDTFTHTGFWYNNELTKLFSEIAKNIDNSYIIAIFRLKSKKQ